MKKAFFKGTFSVLLASALLFSGCGGKECAHAAGEWIVDKDADCETAGSKHTECTLCGETLETQAIEATGHSFESGVCGVCTYVCVHENVEWTVDTQAACVADGEKHSECTLCGETVGREAIVATGHSFENGACKTCNADVWDGTTDASWYVDGTSEYAVSTAEQFAGLAELVAGGNTFAGVTLTLSVDLHFDGLEWTPIGTDTAAFEGTLDGGGHILSELAFKNYAGQYAGVFGNLTGTVKDLHIKNLQVQTATLELTEVYVGGIAGKNAGTVENCSVSGAISAAYFQKCYVGGAIGYNAGTVKNVTADCDVETAYSDESVSYSSRPSEPYVGGFMGYSAGATVENCAATGDVVATEKRVKEMHKTLVHAGGFIGYNDGATIKDSAASGAVSVTIDATDYNMGSTVDRNVNAGGFVGYQYCGVLENNGATGNVSVEKAYNVYAGGFAGDCQSGYWDNAPTTVQNCYATGDVRSTNTVAHLSVGGFAGRASGRYLTLGKCHATGDVGGDTRAYSYTGGFIGWSGVALTECYATGNVSGVEGFSDCYSGGLLGVQSGGDVTKCYATGDVQVTANDLESPGYVYSRAQGGGLIGRALAKVTNCYATGNVNVTAYVTGDYSSYAYAGGLVGHAYGYDCMITKCYATGDVTKKTYAGGDMEGSAYSKGRGYGASFVGYAENATITKSYGAGNVIDAGGGGAIKYFAYKYGSPSISDCYHLDGIDLTKLTDGESTPVTSSDTTSAATAIGTLQTVDFHRNTLGWSVNDWIFADGAYPTLVCFAA